VRDQPTANPTQALRLSHHEDGPATREEFVDHSLLDERPGEVIEDLQQRPRLLASGLRPATQLGYAGGPCTQRNLQEAAGDGEADALGLGHGGELGLAVVVEKDRVSEASLQGVATGLALVELLSEAEDFLALAVQVLQDGVAVAVDGLSAEVMQLGEACDIAVATEEDGGGAAKAIEKG